MIDLSRLERYRENNRIEAKRAVGGLPQSIWETYSSFANTMGGIILLGVEEHADKTLHAVKLPNPERLVREFLAIVNDASKVSANVLGRGAARIERAEGERIVVIEVPLAMRWDRPVYVGGDPYAGTYRRGGEGDYRCKREEVDAMLRDAAFRSQDMRVAAGISVGELDFGCVGQYRKMVRAAHSSRAMRTSGDGQFLLEIGAVAVQDGVARPTLAGLLMFGKSAQIATEFPRYSLEYRPLQGERITAAPPFGVRCGNVFEFFLAARERIICAVPDCPVASALCEALENSLVNADYYGKKGVVVIQKSDGFIFTNPGGFRTDSRYAGSGAVSDPRNPGLIKMFSLIGFGGAVGGGLPAIYALWNGRGWERPAVKESFSPPRTTVALLMRPQRGAQRAHDLPYGVAGQAVISYLTDNISGSAAEISSALGLKNSAVGSCLAALSDYGAVVEEGGRYRLKS